MRSTLVLLLLTLCACGQAVAPGSGSGSTALRIPDDPVPTGDAIALADSAMSSAGGLSGEEQLAQITAAEKALHGITELKRGDAVALSVMAVERALGMLVDPAIPQAKRAAVAQIVLGAGNAERTDDVKRYGPALRHLGQPHGR